MCFSAEASFTAAAILTVAGVITFKNTTSRNQFFLAAIPLLFAVQQFFEGLIWLHLTRSIGSASFFLIEQGIYLFFAFLVWPVWSSLSLLAVEKIRWRRLFLIFIFLCGCTLSVINYAYGVAEPVSVLIVKHSLQYIGHVPDQKIMYPAIVLIPLFISSLKNVWGFGILVIVSYLLAEYAYTVNFVSAWCFFGALVSLFVLKIIKDNQQLNQS
jgi:hypothetical protein